MNKKLKIIVSIIMTVSLSFLAVNAWSWLTSESGDTLDFSKWNDLANVVIDNQASWALLESRVWAVETLASWNESVWVSLDSRVTSLESAWSWGWSWEKKSYNHVIGMRSTWLCPSWYETVDFSDVVWTNWYTYGMLSEHWVLMSSANAVPGYWQETLHFYMNAAVWIDKFCKKIYTSYSKPYITVIPNDVANASNCPSWFTYLDNADLKGSDNNTYFMANDWWSYMGWLSSWAYTSSAYENWYQMKYWSSAAWVDQVNWVCFKIDGVEENPSTKNWVYPVLLWVTDESSCTTLWSDWYFTENTGVSWARWIYSIMTDNSFVYWPQASWGYWWANYNYTYFHDTHVNWTCMKLFPSYKSSVSVNLTKNSTCPSWYLTIDSDSLKWWNATWYLQKMPYWMYLWWLYSRGQVAYEDWYQLASWNNSTWLNNVCIKFEN